MTALTAPQLQELREELDRQYTRLQKSMKVTEEAIRPVELDQTAVGRLSRIDSLQNQNLSKNLHEREEVKFALLREAMERMEKGRYGECTGCGMAIPFERLFVFPETPECSSCG